MNSQRPIFSQASQSLLARSQDKNPDLILDLLVVSAVKESWISLLVNSHVVLFFGLLLLASNYDVDATLIFGGVHLCVLFLISIMLSFLLRTPADQITQNRSYYIGVLTIIDIMIGLAWGLSMLFFLKTADPQQYNALVFMLLAAGITTAALSAKLVRILTVGRLLVFTPSIIYLIVTQPSDLLLHVISLVLSFAVCVGIGYAIHIQLLREAATTVELNESRVHVKRESKFREAFLRSITHDLRQPLNSMSLFVRSLERKNNDTQSEVASIRQCLDASERVLNNVSQLAWVGESLPQPTMSAESLADILGPLVASVKSDAESKGLTIRYRPTDVCVICDSRYLERAIRNLIDNAIHYTDSGGVLIGVRKRLSNGMAEIQVWDTGIGISPFNQQRILEAYERLSGRADKDVGGHLGLGLAIVKVIAKSTNARLEVSSRSGSGTCFSFFVPIVDQIASSFFRNMNVMVVDDDPVYVEFMRTTLSANGASVTVISSDDELSEIALNGFNDSEFVVMDYHLNADFNGADLLVGHDDYEFAVLISDDEIMISKNANQETEICLLRKTTNTEQFIALLMHAVKYY